ncbi:hypothetical protein L210DRAFT_2473300 [Boletus edulis BED1]|uniref:Uncharacterized protein n=1 Tax=Boletus edulis BED1 TaxID=1328754 RepID=A0AAD4BBV6_BOLED|nr:hypothetical protein L210DRAFT_2473300 [Boletus edulis BED1]
MGPCAGDAMHGLLVPSKTLPTPKTLIATQRTSRPSSAKDASASGRWSWTLTLTLTCRGGRPKIHSDRSYLNPTTTPQDSTLCTRSRAHRSGNHDTSVYASKTSVLASQKTTSLLEVSMTLRVGTSRSITSKRYNIDKLTDFFFESHTRNGTRRNMPLTPCREGEKNSRGPDDWNDSPPLHLVNGKTSCNLVDCNSRGCDASPQKGRSS